MNTGSARRRSLLGIAATLVVIAVIVGLVLSRRPNSSSPVAAASAFKTVAVASGTLSTNEQVDGTVTLSNVTQVLHRIEGQRSSTGTTTGTTSGTTTPAAANGAPAASTPAAANTNTATRTNSLRTSRASARPGPPGSPPGTFPGPAPGGSTTTTTACPGTPDGSNTAAPSAPTTATTTTATTTTLGGPPNGLPNGPPTSATTTTPSSTGSPGGSSTAPTTAPHGPPSTNSVPATTSPTTALPTTSTTPIDCGPTTSSVPSTTVPIPATTVTTPGNGGGGRVPTGGGAGTGGSTGLGTQGGTTRVTQMVTSVLPAGSDVSLGTVLYTVESRPVVALAGNLPAWRSLSTSSTDGPDVAQLELSLLGLGYDRDHTMTVDQHFDSATKATIERWQSGYGLDVTGTATLGSFVFLAAPTSVSSVSVSVGDAIGDGEAVMSLAAAAQQVVIDVPAGDESFVVPGLDVTIGDATGTVTLLRSATRDSATVVEAVITPAAPIAGAENGASVKVRITKDHLDGVLLAPAAALASRIDGSYAVQVVAADGTTSWHTIDVLGVSNGTVAIRGEGIVNGTKVLQPL